MFHAKAVLVGSPTINFGVSYAIAGILEMVHGLRLKGKKAAAFGSYGWSGEGVKMMSESLSGAGLEVVDDGLRMLWVPDDAALKECVNWGRQFAEKI